MNCAGSSLLPDNWLKFDDEFLLRSLRNFQASWNDWNSFHLSLELWLSSLKMMMNLFAWLRIGKHVLDTDFWNHSDAATKDLWRRFPWRFNGWSRSWFKIMLWSWGPFVCQETNLFICVMKLSGLQVLDLLARKLWNFLLRNGIAWQLW